MAARTAFLICASIAFLSVFPVVSAAAEPRREEKDLTLFRRENLVAWCIVPFDRKKRGPEERAVMLKRLGFHRFAYDWRAEHVPTFDAEMRALKKQGIALEAFWFPAALDEHARAILDVLKRHHIKTQLWVTMGDPAPRSKEQREKVAAACRVLRLIAEEAAKIGCTVALYNHGGWFGEPENQLAILEHLQLSNVGLVYNLHHGHDHLDRFPQLLRKMRPHLLALNLNGMVKDGERRGQKILPLGQGDLDLQLLKTIRDSGYRGPIGILGHTADDAEERLRDNLDGLDWLSPQLQGEKPGPKPKPRTQSPAPSVSATAPGWLAEGKAEYRAAPLTVECKVRLHGKDNYNILIASDTKQSGAHWEIFSMTGTGKLTAFLPGMQPDHVHSQANLCDGQWHVLGMRLEPRRVQLYLDGKMVAEQAVKPKETTTVAGKIAFGRLVEGGFGCNGNLGWVRLSQGVRDSMAEGNKPPPCDASTIGLWIFDKDDRAEVRDLSSRKNHAQRSPLSKSSQGPLPPDGNHLLPVDKRLKAVLLDRSEQDAYLSVKVDTQGRLFVAAREAVFVFEPKAEGGYEPRQEICRFPADSIIIGLEWRGNDLYVLTANALYLLPEGRVKRGVKPRRLLWGLPLDLHVSFHCLAWGSEGDLYLTHGDPLLNHGDFNRPDHWGHWTLYCQPEGTRVPYTGTGAILRVRPDGSNLRVVAGGLRGPVGLTFDHNWELFSNDNDHESRADLYAPCRLLHVTPHADFAWPRGWLASKSPDRSDLLDLMTDDLGRGVPCDLAYYDDPFLPEEYRHNLLMDRWDAFALQRYPLKARGASFTTKEQPLTTGRHQARPVGVAVGRGGRIFLTALYLSGNVWSPHCCSDLVMITRADDTPQCPFEPYDVAAAPAEKLWTELSSNSWVRRSTAHQEILRRGRLLANEAVQRLATVKENDPAFLHLPWLAAASGDNEATRRLIALAKHPRAEIRLQAVRALEEFTALKTPREIFVDGLADRAPRVQLAALSYFFRSKEEVPLDAVVKLARSPDTYLRQTATRLLARRAPHAELVRLSHSSDEATRLAAILAIGTRLTVPSPDTIPPETLPLTYAHGNAHFALTFADADQPVDLRRLGRVGSYTTADLWKHSRPTAEQQELFDLLLRRLEDAAAPVQLQAAYYLSLLRDSRSEPLVARARQNILLKELTKAPLRAVERVWTVGPFADTEQGLKRVHPPEQGVIDLTASYTEVDGVRAWREVAGKDGRYVEKDRAARAPSSWYVYFRLQSAQRLPALLLLHTDSAQAIKAWHNGQTVALSDRLPSGERPLILDLQPGSNDLLLRTPSRTGVDGLSLQVRAAGQVLAELPEKVDSALLAQRLKEAGGAEKIGSEFSRVDWVRESRKGDIAQGRKLFGTLGCAKCHAVAAGQKGGGAPSLTDAKRRFTVTHVVESILLPSKQVAEPFRSTALVLANGKTVSGLAVRDNNDEVELLLPDASRQTILKKTIEERTLLRTSPMPAGLLKTPEELRHLLAYLLSDNPLPP